ncbi:MAG: ATP-binding protein [Dehalobacterium sp.]
MFKKRIAFQLTAGFVVIVLISMLAIGVLFIQLFKQYAFESREETMLVRARSIAEMISSSQNSWQMRGMGGIMRYLDILAEAKIWITDNQGNLALMSGMGMGMAGHKYNTEPLPEEAEKVIQEVLSGRESVSESFSSVYNEATLTIGVPIINNRQIIGSVLLHAPVTGVTEILNKAFYILVICLLAALFLAAGLGIGYSHFFTRPLKAMNRTALEMAQGNYSVKTGVDREDELGQLGNALDLLAARLDDTIDELFQEKGKLHDIISSISEGLVAFDINLRPRSTNGALSQIMNKGISYQFEALENDLRTLGLHAYLKTVLEQKKPLNLTKEWMGKKLKFMLSPIVDNLGEITGCVALVQDVSESERLEQLRRDFVANVSHEFRTPLTVIRGSLEALVDGTIEDCQDIKHYHLRMLAETQGLERLVGDLLDLSRLQSGKITINREEIYLPTLISDTVKSLQTLADKKEISIHYQSEENLPTMLGDYDRLRQMFVIFLDNAVKYSPAKTLVSVETKLFEANILSVTIRDQGQGILPDQLPYIWDRFYKADTSRKGSGTGLGLAIAKHLIELHHGKVSIQSELGKGTIIEIRMPLA